MTKDEAILFVKNQLAGLKIPRPGNPNPSKAKFSHPGSEPVTHNYGRCELAELLSWIFHEEVRPRDLK